MTTAPLARFLDGRWQFLRIGSLEAGEPVYEDDEVLSRAVASQPVYTPTSIEQLSFLLDKAA